MLTIVSAIIVLVLMANEVRAKKSKQKKKKIITVICSLPKLELSKMALMEKFPTY